MHRLILLTAIAFGSLACSRPGPEVLATYRDGELAVADLDRFMRALPEGLRVAPADGREDWLRGLLRRLAMERVLEAGEMAQKQLSSSETALRRQWASAMLLAAAVTRELAQNAAPDAVAVAEQLAALEVREPVPLDTFRHLFLRLDRAATIAEKAEIRRLGQQLLRRAQAGEDFAEVARQYSQSANAADGGLVENQRPARLEATARGVVAALEEGEISDLIETRTGLHIFKLERRITPKTADRGQIAQRLASRQAWFEARTRLLGELRQRYEVAVTELPWQIGSWQVTAADLPHLGAQDAHDERQQQAVIEQLLLAEEGRRRGFETPELGAQVDVGLRREAIQAAYQQRRGELMAELPAQRLRSLYDARPSAFATLETAEVDLIFLPQGRDSFATQRQVEDHVAGLRSGGDFRELARRISTGPKAEEGGDLGALPPDEWARLGPEIYKAVAGLTPGEISDPIYCTDRLMTPDPRTLRGGFAIVRVRARHPPAERSFEEAIDDVREAWAQQHGQQLEEELRTSILESADFKIVRLPTPEELLESRG